MKIVIYDDNNEVLLSQLIDGNLLQEINVRTDIENFNCNMKIKNDKKTINDLLKDDKFWK